MIRGAIRGADGRGTGHATLVKGSPGVAPRRPGVRAAAAGLRGAVGRVKESFDPAPILNPGRMVDEELSRADRFHAGAARRSRYGASEKVLRACTHCGFCTATCPTYVLLGDELDSPRGRIYLIKTCSRERQVTAETVKHIDRCLSCLACMTTCPSGVNYMHLVDHGRRWIERNYRRPWAERALRRVLGTVLTRPPLFRLALHGAAARQAFRAVSAAPAAPLLALAPTRSPPPRPRTGRRFSRPKASGGCGSRCCRAARRGAGARDQRGDDPAADPARLRGRRRAGQRLLRRARPPSRAGGAGARLRPRQYRRLGARALGVAGSTPS